MTIEVRQILIRSTVGEAAPGGAATMPPPEWVERMRQELLAQCRVLIEQQVRRDLERDRDR